MNSLGLGLFLNERINNEKIIKLDTAGIAIDKRVPLPIMHFSDSGTRGRRSLPVSQWPVSQCQMRTKNEGSVRTGGFHGGQSMS
jgi:hypothetical protein